MFSTMRRVAHQGLLQQSRTHHWLSATVQNKAPSQAVFAVPCSSSPLQKQTTPAHIYNHLKILQSFQVSDGRKFSTSNCVMKLQSSISWHVSNELAQSKGGLHAVNSAAVEDADRLVPKYLVSIALDPYVNNSNILKFYQICSLTSRSLMNDKIAFPEEFDKLPEATEKSFKTMSYEELQQMGGYLCRMRSQKLKLIDRLISSLSEECSVRLKNVSLKEGIQYFEIMLGILDNAITKKPFYGIFLDFFQQKLNDATDEDLIQLMHYSTLNQKTSRALDVEEILQKLQEKISLDSLSFTNAGVIANGTLKSGIRLHPDLPLLKTIEPMLRDKLLSTSTEAWSDFETFSVLAMMNLLRLSRYSDDLLTATVESFLVSCDLSVLNKESIPCFLSYLANKSYHRGVYTRMEQQILSLMRDCDTKNSDFELVHYARIMWSYSNAGHVCSAEFLDEICNQLFSLIILEKMDTNLLKFVDAILSLAILGHIDTKLLRQAFEPLKGRSKFYKGHMAKKLGHRLSMLRQCAAIEQPDTKLPPPASHEAGPDAGIVEEEHPSLRALYSILQPLNSIVNDSFVSMGRPISSVASHSICVMAGDQLNVASQDDKLQLIEDGDDRKLLDVLLDQKCNLCIEVVDDEKSCLRDDEKELRLNGMMKFKIRLMSKMGYKCVLINSKTIEQAEDLNTLIVEHVKTVS